MSSESRWDKALVLLECGWSIIPVDAGTGPRAEKKPLAEWRHFQEEAASVEQVDYWSKQFPDALIGAVTGSISGFVVVDCDNEEAMAYAKECGVWSPIRVKTRRGLHLLFRHPRDGRRFGPRVGSNSTGYDWPQFPGLDFRGDGSYVVAFNAPGYQIQCDPGFDFFDIDEMPVWQGWPIEREVQSIEELDLSTSKVMDGTTEWHRTAMYVAEHYPGAKIPTGAGNGRNDRVARWAGDCVANGIYGSALESRVSAFMDAFYMDHLEEAEWKATCRSIEQAERRNHPERVETFEKSGPKEFEPEAEEPTVEAEPAFSPMLLHMADAPALAAAVASQPLLISPWLPIGAIVHVSGYTGHGKSIVISHILANAAVGRPEIGPFEIPKPCRVLYLDYENGRATLSRRLEGMLKAYGDPGDAFGLWAPWLQMDDLPLNQNASLKKLSELIRLQRPDILVIDTTRSSFPGLEENSAEAWAPINRLEKRLQNYGIATIILHHKNKPQSGGTFSREAGSSAQLNMVETQLYITQVYKDKGRAEATAGIHDETAYDQPVWPRMEDKARAKLGLDWMPVAIFEVRYGKVRDWTDEHEQVQWMALCTNLMTGDEQMIGSTSIRQKAIHMYAAGHTDIDIARTLGISLHAIRGWLGA